MTIQARQTVRRGRAAGPGKPEGLGEKWERGTGNGGTVPVPYILPLGLISGADR